MGERKIRCSDEEIEAIRIALKMKKNLVELKNLAKGSYWCGKHVGPVAVLYQIANHLGITQALGYSKNALLALWLIMARLIDQGSRLSAVRLAQNHAVAEILNLNAFNEDDLYKTLDWLYEHKEKIENRLFKERGHGSSFYLYDVTSSYLEGKENELADWGYNRDKKKGKKQIVYGLLTDEEGEPISIEAFCGNTKDNKTVRVEIETLKERFGCRHITLVGDKGMIKSGEIEDLKTAGFHYITSITKSQIKTLLIKGVFQLSLFDEDLCEVEDREEGVRYILRRNPFRAEEMHKTRLSKIEAIGEKIEKANRYLYEHKRAKIATQIRHIKEYIVKLKLDGLLDVEADEGKKQLKLNVDKEALCRAEELDGCYALKTDLPREVASKETIHDRYKGLSEVEWAFRTQKTGYLQVRPIYVRKRERSIAHLIFVYNDPVGSACTIVGELITVLDRQELNPLEKGIKKEMERIRKERGYDLVVFLIANPLERKGEEIWVKGEKEIVKKAFGVKLEGDSCFIPRILSRKKDFIPKIGYSFEEI